METLSFLSEEGLDPRKEFGFSHIDAVSQYQRQYQQLDVKIYGSVHQEIKQVGKAQIYLIDENWLESNLYQMAEKIHPQLLRALRSVRFLHATNHPNYLEPMASIVYGRVAVLTSLEIFKGYRNNGLGTSSLEEMMEYLAKVLHVSFVIASSNYDPMTERDKYLTLKRFLLKAGFVSTSNGDDVPQFCRNILKS